MSFLGQLTRLLGKEDKTTSLRREKKEARFAHVIEMTDRRLMGLANCRDLLLPAIEFATIYYEEVLKAIPDIIALDDANFPFDSLFQNANDISACLGRSLATKNEIPYHRGKKHERIYALLGMRWRIDVEGRHKLVDHTIRSLRHSPERVRMALLDVAFDSVLQNFANENLHYEKKLEQIRSRQEMLQEANVTPGQRISSSAHAPQIANVALQRTPPEVLAALVDALHKPASRLRLEYDNAYTLEMVAGNKLLPLMITHDRRHWIVCIVNFPLTMAEEALLREHHNHRFILI